MNSIRPGDRVVRRRRERSRIGTVMYIWDRPEPLGAPAMRFHACATVRWEGPHSGVEIVRLAELRRVDE
jgi:hypothetical protein